MPAGKCDIFVSYRRLDTATFSQWLAAELRAKFGGSSVFIDARSIRDGDVWDAEIKASLKQAALVIVVIGKEWLSVTDEFARRRIDLPDDWVRREIETSLTDEKKILPLLVDGAALPPAEALPASIAKLTTFQARQVQSNKLDIEREEISKAIGRLINREPVVTPKVHYPVPALVIEPLDDDNLRRINLRLPGWEVVTHRLKDNGESKVELMRTYVFESFNDAIHFMNTASRFINAVDHHPDWTNIWRTLIVYLTTFDIGHKPSMLDVDLAAHLDDLFKSYQRRITRHDIEISGHR